MEQLTQKTAQKTEQTPEKHSEAPEQGQKTAAGWAAQALLAGAPVFELPHEALRELAQRAGNSGMLALAAMGAPQLQLYEPVLSGPEPATAAFAVPETACELTQPASLTAGSWPSAAADPAGLA